MVTQAEIENLRLILAEKSCGGVVDAYIDRVQGEALDEWAKNLSPDGNQRAPAPPPQPEGFETFWELSTHKMTNADFVTWGRECNAMVRTGQRNDHVIHVPNIEDGGTRIVLDGTSGGKGYQLNQPPEVDSYYKDGFKCEWRPQDGDRNHIMMMPVANTGRYTATAGTADYTPPHMFIGRRYKTWFDVKFPAKLFKQNMFGPSNNRRVMFAEVHGASTNGPGDSKASPWALFVYRAGDNTEAHQQKMLLILYGSNKLITDGAELNRTRKVQYLEVGTVEAERWYRFEIDMTFGWSENDHRAFEKHPDVGYWTDADTARTIGQCVCKLDGKVVYNHQDLTCTFPQPASLNTAAAKMPWIGLYATGPGSGPQEHPIHVTVDNMGCAMQLPGAN